MNLPLRAWKEVLANLGVSPRAKARKEVRPKQLKRGLRVRTPEALEDRRMMAVLYWDPNHTATGSTVATLSGAGGSSGSTSWNTTDSDWYNLSTGVDQVWNDANGDTAVFTGSAGTVAVASGISAGEIDFSASGYSLTGGSLAIGGSGTIDVAAGLTATITTTLNGSNGLTTPDSGTLSLGSANTFSGGTTIEAGLVQIGDDAALSSGAIAISSGAGIDLNGQTIANAMTVAGTGPSSSGAIVNSDTSTPAEVTGTITCDDFSVGGAGDITLDNVNDGTLTMAGTGALSLAGTSDNFSLAVVVDDGTTVLDKASSSTAHAAGSLTVDGGVAELGGSGGQEIYGGLSVTVNTGGTLDLNGQTLTNDLTIAGDGSASQGALINSDTADAGVVSGTITNDGFTVGGGGDITLNTVNGNVLTMDGSGTLTLAGSNDNNGLGLVVDDGMVVLDKASSNSPDVHAIGGGGLTINDGVVQLSGTGNAQFWSGASIVINSGGTFDLNGQSLSNSLTITGDGSASQGALINSDSSDTAAVTGTITCDDFTVGGPGDITLDTVNSDVLTKDGSGTLTLSGSSDNDNLGVIVNEGTVILDKASSDSPNVHAIGGGGLTINSGVVELSGTGNSQIYAGASVTIDNGGTLDLNGESTAGTMSVTGTGYGSDGAIINSDTSTAGTVTGTITSGNFTIGGSGDITLDAVNNNSMTMDGTGTLTLAGSADDSGLQLIVDSGTVILDKASSNSPNVHAVGGGGMTINGGTVRVSGTGSAQFFDQAAVTVNSGGTFDLNGNSATIDSFSGDGTVTNDASGTSGMLTVGFNNSSSTFSGTLEDGSGTLSLSKAGTGTLTLTGDDGGLGGEVAVNGGTVVLNSSTAGSANAAWNLAAGTTLLVADSESFGSLTGAAGSLLTGIASSTVNSTLVMTIGALGTSTTFAGDMTNAGATVLAVDKVGDGVLSLPGTNTNTGPTTYGVDHTTAPGSSDGSVAEAYSFFQISISSRTTGTTGIGMTGDLTASSRWIWAPNWQTAVEYAVTGSVYTVASTTFGPSVTYTFNTDPNADLDTVSVVSSNNPAGTNHYAPFIITDNFYLGGTSKSGKYIAVEDLYNNALTPTPYPDDLDYDDDYWTVNVKECNVIPTPICYPCAASTPIGGGAESSGGDSLNGVTPWGGSYSTTVDPSGTSMTNQEGTAGSGVTTGQPQLLAVDAKWNWSAPNEVMVAFGPNGELFKQIGADPDNSNLIDYAPVLGSSDSSNANDTLVHNLSADTYTLDAPTGEEFNFNGLSTSQPDATAGMLSSSTDAGGNTTNYSYNSFGQQTSSVTPTDTTGDGESQVVTTYLSGGDPNAELRSTVTEQVSSNGGSTWTTTSVTTYSYYSNGDANGSQGDLESMAVTDADGNVTDQQYFIYYTGATFSGSTQVGYSDALLMDFGTASYDRLTTAGLSLSSSQTDLAPYADDYFQYNADQQVTEHIVQGEGCSVCSGGLGEYSYSYAASSFAADPGAVNPSTDPSGYNVWTNKIVETEPNGTTVTNYTNQFGQTILELTVDSAGQEQASYYQYAPSGAAAGQQTLEAGVSAIESIAESDAGLVTLYTNQGLINITDYYSSTDSSAIVNTTSTTNTSGATAGGVAGYVKDTKVEDGTSGTPILKSTTTYFEIVGSSGAINVLTAANTVYTSTTATGPSSSGAETTSDAFTFFSGTTQVEQDTTSLPAVNDQNSSHTSFTDTTVAVYNQLGQEVWSKDANGAISYSVYDTATGAVVKSIQDVDTDDTSEFSGLPSGWQSPEYISGSSTYGQTPLNLVTTYEVDSLGRTVEETDPNDDVTFTVYDDPLHEVRTYSGWMWNPSSDTFYIPTGEMPPPVQVTIDDLPVTTSESSDGYGGTYGESFAMAAPSTYSSSDCDGASLPVGGETIANVTALSISIENQAGQDVEDESYFSLPSLTSDITGSGGSSVLAALGAGSAWNPSTGAGNYYVTTTQYDDLGNVDKTVDADGNITRTVYDDLGRETSTWIGTNDTPTSGYWSPTNNTGSSNMVEVSAIVYDNGGIGDGNMTESIAFPAGNTAAASTFRVTEMYYNWQDEQIATKSGAAVSEVSSGTTGAFAIDGLSDWLALDPSAEGASGDTTQRPITYDQIDNIGETTAEYTYLGNGISLASLDDGGVPSSSYASDLRAETTTSYDAQGRVYQTEVHGVDQSTGAVDDGVSPEISSTIYDADGNVVETIDPLGRTTQYVYDGGDRQIEEIDPTVYDTLTDEYAAPTTYTTYDNDGNVIQVEDPNGNYTTDVYDAAGRQTRVYLPNPTNGSATSTTTNSSPSTSNPETVTTYDSAGNAASTTDPLGNTTDYEYDVLGRQTEVIQPSIYDTTTSSSVNPTTITTYDGNGNVLSVEDPNGNTTYYEYDNFGDIVEMTQPSVTNAITDTASNPVTTDSYDNLGDELSVTDPMSRTTTYSYNVLGQQTSVSQPNPNSGPTNVVTSTAYNVLGSQAMVTDPLGNVTSYQYDGFGNLAEMIQPDPSGGSNTPETFYAYDADNQLVEEIDPAGPASSPNSVEHLTAYQYDDTGRQTAVSQLSGTISWSTTTDTYGVEHLVYSGTSELMTSYGYDLDGNQINVTDHMSNVTTYDYDHLNRETEEIDPAPSTGAANPTTYFAYDFDNNQTSETDPDGNITSYSYNAINEKIEQTQTLQLSSSDTSPAADDTYYGYDANGNMVRELEANGAVTDYSFDALNREIGEDWYANTTEESGGSGDASNVVSYTYDLDSEIITAGDDNSSYTYSYNSLGQETSVESSVSGLNGPASSLSLPNVTLSSTYDANGNRLSLSATVGTTADFVNTYSYDDLNREAQVVQQAGTATGHDVVDNKLATFGYNADGQFASIDDYNSTSDTSGEVMQSSYGYDSLGRLTSLSQSTSSDADHFADYAWTYDDNSQVKSFTNSGASDAYADENVAEYTYDNDGQLIGATQPTGQTANASNSLSDAYDGNGNATSLNGSTTSVGQGNTLLNDGTYNDAYDQNGNLIEQANSTNEILYTYDNRNRLVEVVDKSFEDDAWVKTDEIDYTYDVFNNLIGRKDTTYESDGVTVATQATARNVFDGSNMVLSFDGSGNLTDRYLGGPAVDQVLADEQFELSGTNQLPSSAGNTLWSLDNNQNSVTDVINSAGEIQEHIAYSPFGAQTAQTTGTIVFAFGYTGTYTDTTTGLQLHDFRWYDPEAGRWLSSDPANADINTYRYAENSPLNRTDPFGLIGLPFGKPAGVQDPWNLNFTPDAGAKPTPYKNPPILSKLLEALTSVQQSTGAIGNLTKYAAKFGAALTVPIKALTGVTTTVPKFADSVDAKFLPGNVTGEHTVNYPWFGPKTYKCDQKAEEFAMSLKGPAGGQIWDKEYKFAIPGVTLYADVNFDFSLTKFDVSGLYVPPTISHLLRHPPLFNWMQVSATGSFSMNATVQGSFNGGQLFQAAGGADLNFKTGFEATFDEPNVTVALKNSKLNFAYWAQAASPEFGWSTTTAGNVDLLTADGKGSLKLDAPK
jgi:RHS repeat-associated protein